MERIYTTQEQAWSKTVQCTGTTNSETASCGHLWKVSEHDLVVQQLWEMFDLECVAIGFICPDCGTFTEIPSSTIPTIIANRCYANYRNKKFIRKQVAISILLASHGTKLHKPENPLILTRAKLGKKGIPLHFYGSQDCQHQKHR